MFDKTTMVKRGYLRGGIASNCIPCWGPSAKVPGVSRDFLMFHNSWKMYGKVVVKYGSLFLDLAELPSRNLPHFQLKLFSENLRQ